MSLFKPGLVVDYRLTSSYERLRDKLLTQCSDRLDQPLAYWALPTDRNLPLALISRSLRDLLTCTLNDLYATPGIGPKKISALVVLLSRATEPLPASAAGPEALAEAERPEKSTLNVSAVSESVWAQWRATVRRLGLLHESLGRFASTLEDLPRTLWATPLGVYADLSLADLRRLKTHGRKRVAAVLEVFASLHDVAGRPETPPHLLVFLLPRRVAELDAWVDRCLEQPSLATHQAVQIGLVPLLAQIHHDLGDSPCEVVTTLLRQRTRNLQEAARRLGVSRGTLYEILTNVEAMLRARWPEGQVRLAVLTDLLAHSRGAESQVRLLKAVTSLYSPDADSSI